MIAGSNRWPRACKARALPAELITQNFIEIGISGLEPPTSALSEQRSNQLSYIPRKRREEPDGLSQTCHSVVKSYSFERRWSIPTFP